MPSMEKVTATISRRILVGDKEMVVIFAPPREDFLTSEVPAYMRKG